MEWFSNFIGLSKISRKELDKKFEDEEPLVLENVKDINSELYLSNYNRKKTDLFTDDMLEPYNTISVDEKLDKEIKNLYKKKKYGDKEDIFNFKKTGDKLDVFDMIPTSSDDFNLTSNENKKSDGKLKKSKRKSKKSKRKSKKSKRKLKKSKRKLKKF